MQTRIKLVVDEQGNEDEREVRLEATNATQLKAALFDLVYRGTVNTEDIGVTMNCAVIGASDRYESDVEELADAVESALQSEGYTVV